MNVTFILEKNQIFILHTWLFAYKKARQSNWQQDVLDRYRFREKIKNSEKMLTYVFDKNYRKKIFEERFNNIQV